jgi:glutamyl-tRNA synthetase
VWNPDKLLWLNQQWLKQLPVEKVAAQLVPFLQAKGFKVQGDPRVAKVVVAYRERSKTLSEMAEVASYFFSRGVAIDPKARAKHLGDDGKKVLQAAQQRLERQPDWSAEALDAVVKELSEQLAIGMGKVAQPLRVAVTGNTASPGIGDTLSIVGKDEVLRRLEEAQR